jgi:hypothetical protein
MYRPLTSPLPRSSQLLAFDEAMLAAEAARQWMAAPAPSTVRDDHGDDSMDGRPAAPGAAECVVSQPLQLLWFVRRAETRSVFNFIGHSHLGRRALF